MGAPVQMLWIGPRLSDLERLSMASFLANGHPVRLFARTASPPKATPCTGGTSPGRTGDGQGRNVSRGLRLRDAQTALRRL